jgi:hypothetical protein
VLARGQECPRYTIVGGLAYLVEILVSHLSAESAERWAAGCLAWVGLSGVASWETQCPSASLGMTDFLGGPTFGRPVHAGGGARATPAICFVRYN